MADCTAGPWKYDGDFFVGSEDHEYIIADIGLDGAMTADERREIGFLIAAAPELLVALKLVKMSAGWQSLSAETRRLIEAAVSKAGGGHV